jgi:hypothetical protein
VIGKADCDPFSGVRVDSARRSVAAIIVASVIAVASIMVIACVIVVAGVVIVAGGIIAADGILATGIVGTAITVLVVIFTII